MGEFQREEKKTALTKKKKGEKIPEAPIIVKPIEIVKPASKEVRYRWEWKGKILYPLIAGCGEEIESERK